MELTSINDYNTVPFGTVPQDEKTTDVPHPGASTRISAPGLTSSATNVCIYIYIKNEKNCPNILNKLKFNIVSYMPDTHMQVQVK